MELSKRPALLVGLTGGIGSGKSTVADLFGALGVVLIDTDLIAHALTAPGGEAIEAIRAGFGTDAIAPDGSLDRAAMRARAFGDPKARRKLEAILHPMIRERVARAIEDAAPARYAIVVVPLLVESGNWRSWLDRVLVVDCPVEVQVARVIERSGLAREQVVEILAAQASREARVAVADDVIDNGGTREGLRERVAQLHRHYIALAR
ncbi:MAG: dephospho-CoA kinase [Burkholderiaceae bacterium]|nr:dephospho-CoA kinase [Burkholderiaceae bacterium]